MINSSRHFLDLIENDDPEVRTQAITDSAPEEVWMELVHDFSQSRLWVAQNKTIPHTILVILAEDPNPDVRWWIALKRKTPIALLEMLAQDSNESVRERVAFNAKTPAHVLELLAHDSVDAISTKARERLELGK